MARRIVTTHTRVEVRHVRRVASAAAHPVHDADRIIAHVDARVRTLQDARRQDIMIALPAALAPVATVALIAWPFACTLVTALLALPCLYKVLRKI